MLKPYVLLIVFLFFVHPASGSNNANALENNSPPEQVVYLELGGSSERYFGDLKLAYSIGSQGKIVTCILYLSTQLVGVHTLVKDNPSYDFNVQLADYKAKGKLVMSLQVFPRVSTLSGNFTYSVVANNENFTFIGDLVGWYIKP